MVMEYWKGHCHLIGMKPAEPHLQNLQKESDVAPQVPVANAQIQSPTIDGQPVAGLAAHPRPDFSSVQSGNGGKTTGNRVLPSRQPITGNSTGSVQKDAQIARSSCKSFDQISEEYTQLVKRFEAISEREAELKRNLDEVEKELEEILKKPAEVASGLESQKRLKRVKQAAEKE